MIGFRKTNRNVTLGFILLAQLITTLKYYPFTVTLPDLADCLLSRATFADHAFKSYD